MRTTIPIRAEVTGRDDPFDLPAGVELGQIFVIDGVEHAITEIEYETSREIWRGGYKERARLAPLRFFPPQPTRA